MTPARGVGQTTGLPEVATVLLGLTAFVLGVAGIHHQQPDLPISDVGYRALQLFVLDGAALPNGVGGSWLLEFARLLAPLALALAFIVGFRTLLSERWRRWRTERRRGHIVVCGDGPDARVLADNLADAGDHVVLVRSGAAGGSAAFVRAGAGQARRKSTVVGDARDPATLHAAGIPGAACLYVFGGTGAANAAVALSAVRLRSESRPSWFTALRQPREALLVAFAEMSPDGPTEALWVRSEGTDAIAAFALDFFVPADVAAAALLDRYPVNTTTPVVVGLDALGRAVVSAIVRRPLDAPAGIAAHRRMIIVSGADDAAVQELAMRLDVAKRGCELRSAGCEDGDGRIFVCLPDEDAAVATALRLARAGRKQVVLCLPRATPIREVLADEPGLEVFGVLDESSRAEAILQSSTFVARMARAMHQGYIDDARQRNETEATNPSMVAWPYLPPHLRQSNLAQAEHMRAKLREIDATLTTRRPGTPFRFTDAEVERLAQLEHKRWMSERQAAGFVWGSERQEDFHPDLVEWKDLPKESRAKDISAVRRLPDLLAAEGVHITRITPAGSGG